jgi:serpin B
MKRHAAKIRAILAACMLFFTVAAGACSGRSTDLMPVVPRETRSDVSKESLAAVTADVNAFAFDLYRALADRDSNLFYSPISLSLALAMAYAGARGETEGQMASTLHYTLPQAELHRSLNALDLAVAGSGQGFTLKTANAAWSQAGYRYRQAYLETLGRNYGAALGLLDFTDDGKREQARGTINRWTSDQTEGKIPGLLEKGMLSEFTRLVLTNAIYFKADWRDPFKKEMTRDSLFTLPNGEQVTVPLMSRRGDMLYAEGPDYQAVELPYRGDRVRMVAILPTAGQFASFERRLDVERFDGIIRALQPQDVKLYIPKFRFGADLKLNDTLAEMGMPDAFDRARADFSGIKEEAEPRIFLSHVVHRALVAVDEKGTEAAAASGIVAEIASLPVVLKFDRPFVFAIRDADTGTLLFLGRLVDPRG